PARANAGVVAIAVAATETRAAKFFQACQSRRALRRTWLTGGADELGAPCRHTGGAGADHRALQVAATPGLANGIAAGGTTWRCRTQGSERVGALTAGATRAAATAARACGRSAA